MHTEEGIQGRWWGHLPALRPLLEGKRLQVDELRSSVEETSVEAISRLLTYTALIQQEKDAVLFRASYTDYETSRAMSEELREIETSTAHALVAIREQLEAIDKLRKRLERDDLRNASVVIERFSKRMIEILDELDTEEAAMWRKDLGQLAESESFVADQSYLDFSDNGKFVQSLLTDNVYAHNLINLKLENRFPDPDRIEDVFQLFDALGC